MSTYVIEREIPGAGKLTPGEPKGVSQTSCDVVRIDNHRQTISSHQWKDNQRARFSGKL
ncbi:hypothetical protein [Spirosoma validum]|uniref:hypothetical protein n=1 Tax=Spirosoma validum TaxID=2771355 RepID=UPI001CC27F78|nr:hypothetical protein [Spirosoma validum]